MTTRQLSIIKIQGVGANKIRIEKCWLLGLNVVSLVTSKGVNSRNDADSEEVAYDLCQRAFSC